MRLDVLQQAPPPVLLVDAGGHVVGSFPLGRVARFVDADFAQTVRDRKGRVRRITWLRPTPELEPFRRLRAADFAGQRYVFRERLNDGPLQWALRDTRRQPQVAFLKVVVERGAELAASAWRNRQREHVTHVQHVVVNGPKGIGGELVHAGMPTCSSNPTSSS